MEVSGVSIFKKVFHDAIKFLLDDDKIAEGWRGKHEAWDKEIANQLARKKLIQKNDSEISREIKEYYFLFEEVFESCCNFKNQNT
jgi:sulfur relay (sulfurtransferase) DsrC/TusE family protein